MDFFRFIGLSMLLAAHAVVFSLDHGESITDLFPESEWPDYFVHPHIPSPLNPAPPAKPRSTPDTSSYGSASGNQQNPQFNSLSSNIVQSLQKELKTCQDQVQSLQTTLAALSRKSPVQQTRPSFASRVEHIVLESVEEIGEDAVHYVENLFYRTLVVIAHGIRILSILAGIVLLFMLFVTASEVVDTGSDRSFTGFVLMITFVIWALLSLTVYGLHMVYGPHVVPAGSRLFATV